jgi:hypothetical protein
VDIETVEHADDGVLAAARRTLVAARRTLVADGAHLMTPPT